MFQTFFKNFGLIHGPFESPRKCIYNTVCEHENFRRKPLKGKSIGEGKGKERRGARLDILYRGPRVPSYATVRGVQRHPRRRKMRHRNPQGDKNKEVRGIKFKILATRCHILRLKCTNSISAGVPPHTPLGELTALPQTLMDLRGPISKGREG